MKKYFSSAVCSHGSLCIYNTIYKQDASSRVYIASGGDDYETATFFSRLSKNLTGYSLTLFNPFYDEAIDGIYIESLNTYVISDCGYGKFTPVLPGIWEKRINITESKCYSKDLIKEVLFHKSRENMQYKNACKELKKASIIKERIHSELSPYLNEEKIINFIHRFCKKELKITDKRPLGNVRLLSSPTPLGIHTHYDTVFHMCDKVINIIDDTELAGSVILGVLKNCALKSKISVIASPTYFCNDFWSYLILPTLKLGLCISNNSHLLPFTADEVINTSRFFYNDDVLNSKKVKTLSSIENKFLDRAVLSLYEGRDERFKYNYLLSGYSNGDEAKFGADKLAEKLLN